MTGAVLLLDELVMEILSFLPVKDLMRFVCVSKQFESLICDPSFVEIHVKRSGRNILYITNVNVNGDNDSSFLLSFPLESLLGSSVTVTLSADDHHLSRGFDMQNHKYSNNDDPCHKICGVVGWCNGLVCLNSYEFTDNNLIYTFRLWNPATRKTYADPHCVLVLPAEEYASGACGFGYDNLTHAYKLVLVKFFLGSPESIEVRVCTIPQHHSWTWAKIQNFPAEAIRTHTSGIYGAYLNNTLNWMAKESCDSDELLIVSLHLSKERYTKYLLPPAPHGLLKGDFRFLRDQPVHNTFLAMDVLEDCLSLFFHNPRTDQFALWQMKEFGNENSWTLLFNLSHLDLQIDQMACYLKPMRILENGAILIIHRTFCQEQEELGRHWRSILYNGRDKTVKHAEILGNIGWIFPRQCVQSMAFFGRSN